MKTILLSQKKEVKFYVKSNNTVNIKKYVHSIELSGSRISSSSAVNMATS